MARLLVIACILMSLFAIWWLPAPWVVLHEAAAGFVFLAAFMTVLALLRLPAYRSKLIHRCGQSLLMQPPTCDVPICSHPGPGVYTNGSSTAGVSVGVPWTSRSMACWPSSTRSRASANPTATRRPKRLSCVGVVHRCRMEARARGVVAWW